MKVSIFPWIAKKLKQCMAITQDGDTADRAIASGKYVCWKSDMYTANQAINSGDTLSAGSGGNLTAVDDGIANDLNSEIATLNSKFCIIQKYEKGGHIFPNSVQDLTFNISGFSSVVAAIPYFLVESSGAADYGNIQLSVVSISVSSIKVRLYAGALTADRTPMVHLVVIGH